MEAAQCDPAGAGQRPSPGRHLARPGARALPLGGFRLGGCSGSGEATPIKIAPEDFNAFERLLGESQAAYSREDLGALRGMSTPEMASYFDDELEENRRKGVINRVSDVKLLQGDVSEAWREGVDEYATVAMRFALNDVLEDRATGKPAPGSPGPTETSEAWTFRRPAGAGTAGVEALGDSAGGVSSALGCNLLPLPQGRGFFIAGPARRSVLTL